MPQTLENWLVVLRDEFDAADGTFLAIAQEERRWDREAFRALIEAMRECCVSCSDEDQLDRWMAHGFFYVPAFVRAWTQQPEFESPDAEYWHEAIRLLEALSHWYFWAEPPTEDGDLDFLSLE